MIERQKQLIDKLLKFKDTKKFKTWGFSHKGYHEWMDEAKEINPYLSVLGIEFYKSGGVHTDYSEWCIKQILGTNE